MSATSLCILVTEHGETRARLTFGAAAADILPDLIPAEVRPRLAARCIDVAALAADARSRDYAPGELFALEEGDRSLRVWLE